MEDLRKGEKNPQKRQNQNPKKIWGFVAGHPSTQWSVSPDTATGFSGETELSLVTALRSLARVHCAQSM